MTRPAFLSRFLPHHPETPKFAIPGPRRGEFVTCENGHLICEVLEDIEVGSLNWARKLGHFRIPEPMIGQSVPTCPCGALWCGHFHKLHIEGRGWVPPLETSND